jgi:glucokinase
MVGYCALRMGERLIGVDVGGTKVSVAVLEDGELSEPVLRPTEQSSSEALVDQLVEAIEDAGPAAGVGLGVPSVIDFATGTARTSVNIPLQGVPLRQQLTERVGIPTFVDNDATVAALAEAYDDDFNLLAESLVMITVGTGVGGGIVIGGRIYRGATGAAPELGHIIVGADLTHGAPSIASAPNVTSATGWPSSPPPTRAIPTRATACASSASASGSASPTS